MLWLLVKNEFKKMVRNPINWIILALFSVFLGLLFYRLLTDHLQVAFNLIERQSYAGLTREVIKPFFGWCLITNLLMIPMVTAQIFGSAKQNGHLLYLKTHHVPTGYGFLSKLIAMSCFNAVLLLIAFSIPSTLMISTQLDTGLLLSNFLGVFCYSTGIMAISLFCHTHISQNFFAFILTMMMSVLLSIIEWLNPLTQYHELFKDLSMLNHAHHLLNGLIITSDLMYFVILTGFLGLLSLHAYYRNFNKI